MKPLVFVAALILAAGMVLSLLDVPLAVAQTPTVDYGDIATDRDKLSACYSLIEQARQEHNAVAALARAQPEKYLATGKFKTYVSQSWSCIQALLAEQNTLKERIRRAAYTDETWTEATNSSTEDELRVALELWGNRQLEKQEPTLAWAPSLNDLRATDLDKLMGSVGFDPTEDFTTYTEYDEGNDITVTTDRLTLTNLDTDADTFWVYDDKGAAHFDADFEHLEKVYLSSTATNCHCVHWMLANDVGDLKDIKDASGSCLAAFWYDSGSELILAYEVDAGTAYSDASSALSLSTVYYLEIERDEAVGTYGTLYIRIATTDYYGNGGNLVDTLSVALHTAKRDFRYVYGVTGYDSGVSRLVTGYVELLDLQEVTPPSVDTDAADDLEDTTATLNGEVIAIADSIINARAFAWDTSSHADPGSGTSPYYSDYAYSWNQTGTYGTGVFDHGVTSLASATLHYFRAAARNDNTLWDYGDELTFLTKPAAPTNVAATDGVHTDKVVVTWTKSSGTVTGYKVYRDAGLIDTVGDVATYDDTGAAAPTITPGAASATDGVYEDRTRCTVSGESGNDGTTHTYKVRAYNDTGDSDDSATDTGYRGKSTLNYNWYKSWADTASNYTAVGNYSEPYDDMSPAMYPSGRHYLCAFNMTDAVSQNSTADRGYAQSTNVTAIYLYPNWQAKLVGLNASVWAVAWHGATVAANATVTWNVTGNGTIEWSETTTGGDGRADALISCNVTENVTVCAISGNCSDCGIIAFHTETGGGTDLPLWYFAIIGVALVGAFYTKDMMLYIMAVVACGGGVWFAQNSSLESEIALVLTATFVILGAVMVFGMLRHGNFSFIQGGDTQ